MSGNSGSQGRAGGFDRDGYERELGEFRRILDNTDVVGFPRRNVELYELERLIAKYPAEARRFLDGQTSPDGSVSPP